MLILGGSMVLLHPPIPGWGDGTRAVEVQRAPYNYLNQGPKGLSLIFFNQVVIFLKFIFMLHLLILFMSQVLRADWFILTV